MRRILPLVFALGLATLASRAQTPGTGGPAADPNLTAVPLDGGASLLLAGGVTYGLRKLRQRRPA